MNVAEITLQEDQLVSRISNENGNHAASLGDNEEVETMVWSPNLVWREKVVQWCYDVIDHLEEDRSVVYIAMDILDRYCAMLATDLDERMYELASLSAIFLAVRVAGSGDILLSELLSMSRNGISVQDLIATGTKMIDELNWENAVVTPTDYVKEYVQLLPGINKSPLVKRVITDSATYLTEISVCDIEMSQANAALVAAAAMLNAVQATLPNEIAAFMAALQDKSSMNANSDVIKGFSARLQVMYSRSMENDDMVDDEDPAIEECFGPHLIEDDDGSVVSNDATVAKRSYRVLGDVHDDEEGIIFFKRNRPSDF